MIFTTEKVVTRDLNAGNGIEFTNMTVEDSAKLRQFIEDVVAQEKKNIPPQDPS